MQKVSKQSLAMIALSILLAISIALTFTFAAVANVSKTATGTLTFSGKYSIVWAGGGDVSIDSDNAGNGMTFTLDETWFKDTTAVGDTTITASLDRTTHEQALKALTVTFTNTTATASMAHVSYKQTSEGTGTCDCQLSAGAKKIEIGANSSATQSLYDIISTLSVKNATGAALTFTLTATIGGSAV